MFLQDDPIVLCHMAPYNYILKQLSLSVLNELTSAVLQADTPIAYLQSMKGRHLHSKPFICYASFFFSKVIYVEQIQYVIVEPFLSKWLKITMCLYVTLKLPNL